MINPDEEKKTRDVDESRREVPPLVEAMKMLSHIITAVCLMLVAGGIGYGLDHWIGGNIFTLLGFAGGGYLAVRHLLQVTSKLDQ